MAARPHTAHLLPKVRSAKKKRSACCSAHRDDSSNGGHDGVQVHDLPTRGRRARHMSRWGFAACFAGAPQRAGNVRERGASRAAGVAQGGGDGMHACMGRVRRACTCPARDVGHARGRGALGGGAFAPPRQLGASSRRRLVASPTLKAAAKPPDSCRTRSPPRICEQQQKNQLDKA